MAIDADDPAAGPDRLTGSQLDLDSGQDDTSFHFDDTGGGLPSEIMPYIVLPLGPFRKNTGLAIGDVATVIYKDKITAAICNARKSKPKDEIRTYLIPYVTIQIQPTH
jgi:hypothetical protein